MLKIRLTFVDDEAGQEELETLMSEVKESYRILNESKIYKGRNGSMYSNVYLDIEKK